MSFRIVSAALVARCTGLAAGATPRRNCRASRSDAVATLAKGSLIQLNRSDLSPRITFSQSAIEGRLALRALPLLSRSPTVRRCIRCQPERRTASHVRPWGSTLSVLARVCEYSGARHLPGHCNARLSARQDSKTRRLLSQAFIATGLTGLRPATRITSCKRPRGTPFRVELSARLAACAARSRARQFSLAPLYRHRYLSSPPCSTRPTVTGWPRAGLTTRTPMDRHRAAFPLRSRFRVAHSLGLEWGRRRRCSPQRPGTDAPALLRARGYRGLLRRRAKHGPSSPDELGNRGWQPLFVLKLAGVAFPVLAARRRTSYSHSLCRRDC